jgi:tetratricopeptide (TPR) repeat protein
MNNGAKLAILAAIASVGTAFVISSMRARASSSTSSITKRKNNNSNNSGSPSNVGLSVLLDSGRVYYGRGDYKKADIFFERILEIEPNHI